MAVYAISRFKTRMMRSVKRMSIAEYRGRNYPMEMRSLADIDFSVEIRL